MAGLMLDVVRACLRGKPRGLNRVRDRKRGKVFFRLGAFRRKADNIAPCRVQVS